MHLTYRVTSIRFIRSIRIRVSYAFGAGILPILATIYLLKPQYDFWAIEQQEKRLYEKARPFSYRWPGAKHASYAGRASMGSAEESATNEGKIVELALLKLRRTFESDPRWLQLSAGLSLLEGHYGESASRFRQAQTSDANAALAIALALRAETDGRGTDYGQALEYTARAADLASGNAVVNFNIALLLEKVSLLRLAQKFWEKEVALETEPGWKAEAREHLRILRRSLDSRSKAQEQLSNPGLIDKNLLAEPGALELAQQTAINSWTSDPGGHPKTEQVLAAEFEGRHHDRWWVDFLRSPGSREARQLLGRAQRDYEEGRFAAAEKDGTAAETSFNHLGNRAGALRARWQRIVASHRGDNPSLCPELLKGFEVEAKARSWQWLLGQYWLDEIACRNLLYLGSSLEDRENVLTRVETIGFEGITLRAIAFLAEPQIASGSPKRLWSRGLAGLSRFWPALVPDYRIHHLTWCLAEAAKMGNQPRAAVLFEEESALNLEREQNTGLRAQIMSELAAAESHAGLYERAARDFDSIPTINTTGPDSLPQRYFFEIEQNRAQAELQAGHTDAAIRRLTKAMSGNASRRTPNEMERAELDNILGTALLKEKRFGAAAARFAESMTINQTVFALDHDQVEKESLRQLYESAFRGTTEARLRMGSSAEAALKVWDEFRGGTTKGPNKATARIAFASLPGGMSAWISFPDRTIQRWLDGGAASQAALQLTTLAADPSTPLPSIQRAGQEAGRYLLGPLEPELEANPEIDTLLIDSDDTLARLPWALIVLRDGNPLIRRYTYAVSVGPPRRVPDKLTRLSRVAIFADPDPGELRAEFPALTDAAAEGKMVSMLFPRSTISEGRDATEQRLLQQASGSDILHFAGHGITNGGFGGVMLAGSPHFLTADQISRSSLGRLKLVVLSACSTGIEQESSGLNADTLIRGFLDAGAARVVASSWDVDSRATRKLMRTFYEELARGQQPAKALRLAMLELASTGDGQHPANWAAFQVYGSL